LPKSLKNFHKKINRADLSVLKSQLFSVAVCSSKEYNESTFKNKPGRFQMTKFLTVFALVIGTAAHAQAQVSTPTPAPTAATFKCTLFIEYPVADPQVASELSSIDGILVTDGKTTVVKDQNGESLTLVSQVQNSFLGTGKTIRIIGVFRQRKDGNQDVVQGGAEVSAQAIYAGSHTGAEKITETHAGGLVCTQVP
jgi:hypothetical protein